MLRHFFQSSFFLWNNYGLCVHIKYKQQRKYTGTLFICVINTIIINILWLILKNYNLTLDIYLDDVIAVIMIVVIMDLLSLKM